MPVLKKILLLCLVFVLKTGVAQSIDSLSNNCIIYYKKKDYKAALPIAIKIRDFYISEFGSDDIDTATFTELLASIYHFLGEYELAEPLYVEELSVRKKRLDSRTTLQYGLSLNLVGVFYSDVGNYEKAENLLLESINILQSNNDKPSKNSLKPLNDLANLYSIMDDYLKSDSILNQLLPFCELFYGKTDSHYFDVLSSLSDNCNRVGDFKKSKKLYREIAEGQKAIISNNKIEYRLSFEKLAFARTLSRMAKVMFENDEIDSARKYCYESMSVIDELEFEKDTYVKEVYQNNLNTLALICDISANYKEADSLFDKTFSLVLQNKYSRSNKIIRIINNHSISLINRGEFNYARECLSKVINKFKDTHNDDNDYAETNKLLGIIYQEMDSLEESEYFLEQYLKISNRVLNNTFIILTEEQIIFFLDNIINTNSVEERIKSINLLRKLSPGFIYDNELLRKNTLVRQIRNFRNSIIESNDTILKSTFYKLINIKNLEYKKIALNEEVDNLEGLKKISESLEKKLIRDSKLYRELKFESSNFKDVREKLSANEAAVEFISFNYYDKKWTDSIIYCALVLKANDNEPHFVQLFEQKQLETLLKNKINLNDSAYINSLYQYPTGKALQELIWQKLDSLMNGINTIYLAPSGLLHNINFSSLPVSNNQFLGQQYKIHILGTTGDILKRQEQFINNSTISKSYVFGGIDYDKTSNIVAKTKAQNNTNFNLIANSRSVNSSWSFLKNTLYEIASIDSLCKQNKIITEFISGSLASENAFKNISGETSPFILHLATHGYFFPDLKKKMDYKALQFSGGKQAAIKMSDNPLLRSGLIFSGANKTWNTPNNSTDTTEDGILTAYEISNLDLSGAKLVVMSACKTGLGDIKGSEGVFGLQRSFKLAGANNIIMSLWDVPDTQTKELMKLFYENCFAGMSVSTALQNAQFTMSKKFSPYYWAAFKLLE